MFGTWNIRHKEVTFSANIHVLVLLHSLLIRTFATFQFKLCAPSAGRKGECQHPVILLDTAAPSCDKNLWQKGRFPKVYSPECAEVLSLNAMPAKHALERIKNMLIRRKKSLYGNNVLLKKSGFCDGVLRISTLTFDELHGM